VCLAVLVAVEPEGMSTVSRRHSSVVSMPMSRRSTADPVPVFADPTSLRSVGINVSLQTAAAVAAVVAATTVAEVPPPGPRTQPPAPSSSAAATVADVPLSGPRTQPPAPPSAAALAARRFRSHSTADCTARPQLVAVRAGGNRRDQQQNSSTSGTAEPCSVVGCTDDV